MMLWHLPELESKFTGTFTKSSFKLLWLTFTLNIESVPTWSKKLKENVFNWLYDISRSSSSGKFWKASYDTDANLFPFRLILLIRSRFIKARLSKDSILLSSKWSCSNFGRLTNVCCVTVLIALKDK